jgi:hypothetical protein
MLGEVMKKVLLLIILLFGLCGCSNLKKDTIDEIIKETTESKIKLINQYRTGFKYYLPSNLSVINSEKLNEVITNGREKYYIYIDLVSYYEKQDFTYTETTSFYSTAINYDDKKGYLEINEKNEQYLIEIMYNYAKIEVIVDKENINEAVANSLIILSSIEYNDDIIENMIGEDILNYSEEEFTIFDTTVKDSNFLEYVQEYDNYDSDTDVPDYDLIN